MKRPGLQLQMKQRQVMAFALQQSLYILQLSELELTEWIREEIERNPLLEEIPRRSSSPLPIPDIASKPTLREHLLAQARESMVDLPIAEFLIGHLDEKGYLSLPLDNLSWSKGEVQNALATIQTFDPPGIGARSLQEALLLQLQRRSYSLAEIVIRDHFQDLLLSRFKTIQKQLGVSASDFSIALNQISKLRMRPAELFDRQPPPQWIADVIIQESEEGWVIRIGEEELPPFRMCKDYKALQNQCSPEEKKTLKRWHISGRWLARCIQRRREALFKIALLLLEKRKSYFETGKATHPIGIKELALHLSVHPTTAWRAVANKTLLTPYGMIPLQSFFSDASAKDPVKELLGRLIRQEDKRAPYTDEDLSRLLQENGLSCARRTVSKYRKALKIGSATKRKMLSSSF